MFKKLKKYFIKGKGKKPQRKRSVLFYRHSYYHFFYLAQELRKRGWDAVTVNLEDPNGPNANYYHGEDINLYHPNPKKQQEKITQFFYSALSRFDLMHFAGDGYLGFHLDSVDLADPPDIQLWKKKGKKIAYTISGCEFLNHFC